MLNRRQFVSVAAGAIAGLSLGSLASAAVSKSPKRNRRDRKQAKLNKSCKYNKH
jgi:hypothetical protein